MSDRPQTFDSIDVLRKLADKWYAAARANPATVSSWPADELRAAIPQIEAAHRAELRELESKLNREWIERTRKFRTKDAAEAEERTRLAVRAALEQGGSRDHTGI